MTQILEHAAAVGHATARACSIRAGRWLVGGALRQPDAIAASDRSAVPEHQQPESGHGGQPGSISGHLFRPQGAARCAAQLDPEVLGERMECDAPTTQHLRRSVSPHVPLVPHRVGNAGDEAEEHVENDRGSELLVWEVR